MLSPSSRAPLVLSLVLLPVMPLSGGEGRSSEVDTPVVIGDLRGYRARHSGAAYFSSLGMSCRPVVDLTDSDVVKSAVAFSRPRGSGPLCPFKPLPG